MIYKNTVRLYLYTISVLIGTLLSIIWIHDPYMLFHKQWFHPGKMLKNMRIQSYGLIKFADFDSIILGTSMLENTSADEASAKLGGKFANLSISAATYYEKFKVLSFAIKHKKIKKVILSLDLSHFAKAGNYNDTFEPQLYSWNSLYGKAKIYLTDHALKCIFANECSLIDANLDRPNAWFEVPAHNSRFGGFENWLAYPNNNQIRDLARMLKYQETEMQKENLQVETEKNIRKFLLKLFENKDVQFHVIIPPYSLLYWAKFKNSFDNMSYPYVEFIKKTAEYKNVTTYWFYDEDFVGDIQNYKDLTHYHYSINSLMLDAVRDQTHTINIDNYRQKLEEFKQRIDNYDADYYIKQINFL